MPSIQHHHGLNIQRVLTNKPGFPQPAKSASLLSKTASQILVNLYFLYQSFGTELFKKDFRNLGQLTGVQLRNLLI
jgi:hypothetical protein